MHALGKFIQHRLDARGWKQIDLVRASGLTKQVVSRLLSDDELHRMIAQPTIEGLAKGLGVEETVIILKSAEAIGVPVDRLAPIVINEPSDEVVVEMVREALLLRRRQKEAQPVAVAEASEAVLVPNSFGTDDDAGEHAVSGEKRTTGDPRVSGHRSRGSDSDAPERRRTSERTAPPSL
jgi:transcriptional regulator with XRE-family HTH domain